MSNLKTLFFGYPSNPVAVREANSEAASTILSSGLVTGTTWERLKVSGRFIINQILHAIQSADLCIFDVTVPNENVMFELGYAIGANKPVWLVRDPSWEEADQAFQAMRILTTVGYVQYTSSEEIRAAFFSELPYDSAQPIFASQIQPTLTGGQAPTVVHLMSPHKDDAARAIARAISKSVAGRFEIVQADPDESTSAPLAWYAQQVHQASATVVHLTAPERRGAKTINARYALVAGLAHGMGKDVMMIGSSDYLSPIDYRDLLSVYTGSQHASETVESWVSARLPDQVRQDRAAQIQLATELRSLRLGEHIAENEVARLGNYFIETAGYRHALSDATSIIVGRKGTGKTATFFELAAALEVDARVLTVVIKPHSYELEGLVQIFKKFSDTASREFIAESIWRLLLYTEIAAAAVEELRGLPAGAIRTGSPERELLEFAESVDELLQIDFASRVESVVEALVDGPERDSIREERKWIGEALHESLIPYLRQLLGKVLSEKRRVAVLIDNLDKAWGTGNETELLSHFLIGLLSSAPKISQEFAKQDHWRDPINVTLSVFIRQDIYRFVQRIAREPDKLPIVELRWDDLEQLAHVLDARYEAARDIATGEGELWSKYFEPTVRGLATRDYLVSRVLPRPRDLVFFANAAIEVAIGRGHPRVSAEDVLKAEEAYSQFAFEALQVEYGEADPPLQDVVYEFAGGPSVMDRQELEEAFDRAGVSEQMRGELLERLLELSFLGVETRDTEFEFFEASTDTSRTMVLARRLANQRGQEWRYAVHPAYRTYLEIMEPQS